MGGGVKVTVFARKFCISGQSGLMEDLAGENIFAGLYKTPIPVTVYEHARSNKNVFPICFLYQSKQCFNTSPC